MKKIILVINIVFLFINRIIIIGITKYSNYLDIIFEKMKILNLLINDNLRLVDFLKNSYILSGSIIFIKIYLVILFPFEEEIVRYSASISNDYLTDYNLFSGV